MSCLSARVFRRVSAKADRRMDETLAGTVKDELLSATDDRTLDDFSWE
jgi:hypothetical protein